MKIRGKKLAVFSTVMALAAAAPVGVVVAGSGAGVASQITVADSVLDIDTEYSEVIAQAGMPDEKNDRGVFSDKVVAVADLDVYSEADTGSEVAGKLGKNNIASAEKSADGWTKIRSGELTGYVKSESLCFADEAEAVALLNGNVKATAKSDDTSLFKDASLKEEMSDVKAGEALKVVDVEDSHIVVEKDDVKSFVKHGDVDVDPGLSFGKTTRQIAEEEAKKKAEEEAKKKAEEEARKKSEEEAKKKAEAEAKKRAEEEAAKMAAERASSSGSSSGGSSATASARTESTDTTGWSSGVASAYGGATDPGCGSITANGSYVSESSMGVAIPLAWGRRDLLGHQVLISYGGKTVTAVINDLGGMGGGSRALDLQPGVFRALGANSCDGWGLRTVQYKIL